MSIKVLNKKNNRLDIIINRINITKYYSKDLNTFKYFF